MMKIWYMVVLFILLLTGCRAQTKIVEVPVREVVTVTETLEPIQVPGDSLIMEALFYCDSLNLVQLREISELKSKNMSSGFKFDRQKLEYKAKTEPALQYIPSTIIETTKEVPIYVDVPGPIEYRLHWYQRWLMWIGVVASISLAVWLLLKLRLR